MRNDGMTLPVKTVMHRAVAQRDKSYDGRFLYGVITTGVFCKPSCTSRRARAENIRFFTDAASAMNAGFRPCQRCRPTDSVNSMKWLCDIARFIEKHGDERLTLKGLANQVGLSPSHLQRRFKAAFGVSPKAYQDAVRVRHLKRSLKQGKGVTSAIYSAGFGSISRVYGAASHQFGMTPKAYQSGGTGETVYYACRDTAIGPMLMAATHRGVCFVEFGEDEGTLMGQLSEEFPCAKIAASPAEDAPELDLWIKALDAHISVGAPCPDLPLDLRGTAFQVKVWRFLLNIHAGEVMTYTEVAAKIDKPKAARSVGSACTANRIGVLIPCHRVLRGDGKLGGYRWGVDRKRALLDLERARIDENKSP
ncbi:bifunctional DNA-binding transcriptional regulator/O6-methylguanine-DNA methyltransferase Ada [Candidatus Thiodiazotropha sp. LNASS1]|uniref:bifunctional DNA-binding transcriptional regulator/O6-methylguanine-DNA methyltransferase Ada n=1 Tax=Candidatus Thiodiazotropha sp. LNASS1 TaxID=3096260 RepID=UPI0034DF8AC4